jgi:E1A/CREB-binding protein
MTQDRDPDMGSEFFETRQAFLSLCQGNHYQFDSMRRAKHSSMMVLYHLHNPEAPAFSSTCNFCHVEIEPGTGLRCTVCSDFDMCKNCKAAGMRHEHPMVVSGRHHFSFLWQFGTQGDKGTWCSF